MSINFSHLYFKPVYTNIHHLLTSVTPSTHTGISNPSNPQTINLISAKFHPHSNRLTMITNFEVKIVKGANNMNRQQDKH